MKHITYNEKGHKKAMDRQFHKGLKIGIEKGERECGISPFIWGMGLSSIFWLFLLW
jgi:hypothetical protein